MDQRWGKFIPDRVISETSLGRSPCVISLLFSGVYVENFRDLKSLGGFLCAGSSPAPGILFLLIPLQ